MTLIRILIMPQKINNKELLRPNEIKTFASKL